MTFIHVMKLLLAFGISEHHSIRSVVMLHLFLGSPSLVAHILGLSVDSVYNRYPAVWIHMSWNRQTGLSVSVFESTCRETDRRPVCVCLNSRRVSDRQAYIFVRIQSDILFWGTCIFATTSPCTIEMRRCEASTLVITGSTWSLKHTQPSKCTPKTLIP